MKQPKKINRVINKTTITKKQKVVKQPIPKDISFWVLEKDYKVPKNKDKKKEPGVSNLEVLFEEMFLKKLKLKYIYQWKSPTGRFFDFAILNNDGTIDALIEVDGDFWHANPKFYDRNNLIYENQKRQIRIDKEKNEFSALSNYVLLRYWEYDIKHYPKEILKDLKKRLKINIK